MKQKKWQLSDLVSAGLIVLTLIFIGIDLVSGALPDSAILGLLFLFFTSEFISRQQKLGHIQETIENGIAQLSQKEVDPSTKDLMIKLAYPEKMDVTEPERQGLKEMRDQLWNEEITLHYEATAPEVWIVTPELMWEEDLVFGPVIKQRIKDGNVKYRELYLNNDKNNQTIAEYSQKFEILNKDWQSIVKYVPIDAEDFGFLYAEHALYILDEKKIYNSRLILASLVSSIVRTPTDFNVELKSEPRREFIDQFRRVWNSKVTEQEWKIPTP